MFARVATAADLDLVLEIHNAHQLAVAPELGTDDVSWAKDFIQGYPEPTPAWILSDDEKSVPFATGNLNPSANAMRFQVDLRIRPGTNKISEALDFFLAKAAEYGDGWDFWIDCNDSEIEFKRELENRGLRINRYFNTLRRELVSLDNPILPEGANVRLIDIFDDRDVKIWHELRHDAFSKHFGFVPRPFEQFVEIMRKDHMIQGSEVFVLCESQEPAGYIWLTDVAAHELTGYVANIGVSYAHQGKGFGAYLLGMALARYSDRGFKRVDLDVDTGNESGALRLYEKLGFKKVTTWVQYEK
ncbi:MAG: GNAT family N-acetyltransferase [Rhodoluna sp.]